MAGIFSWGIIILLLFKVWYNFLNKTYYTRRIDE